MLGWAAPHPCLGAVNFFMSRCRRQSIAVTHEILAIKAAIPQLQRSGIDEAMLPMIYEPRLSHPYVAPFEKDSQHSLVQRSQLLSPFDPETALLWKSCQERVVDQEAVDG